MVLEEVLYKTKNADMNVKWTMSDFSFNSPLYPGLKHICFLVVRIIIILIKHPGLVALRVTDQPERVHASLESEEI